MYLYCMAAEKMHFVSKVRNFFSYNIPLRRDHTTAVVVIPKILVLYSNLLVS